MNEFIITTDNTDDLPESFYKEHGIAVTYLSYVLDGVNYSHENFLSPKDFYRKMRDGEMPTTAQATPPLYRQMMEPLLKEGKDILHLGFSSGLSGSCGSAMIAADELRQEYPDRKIIVIDTLAASLGEGLLVYYAQCHKEAGEDIDTVAKWVEDHRLNLAHLFTVDDLTSLWRGGRVKRSTAVVAGILNIKPILHVDDEGHLINIGKVRGRKKSILELVKLMEEKIGSHSSTLDTIFISHGDCLEDAKFLEQKVREKWNIKNIIINDIGPVIGAHSGPGTLALFFLSDQR